MTRVPRKRSKLAMWSALPPYLGGKRRLCSLIFREIDRLVPRRRWSGLTFLDGFLGGGSVSLYAKAQGFRVVATDIATRAITVGQAVIANSRVRLAREDVLRLLGRPAVPPGRIERQFVPSVFTKNVGRFLDAAFETAARTGDVAKAALLRLLAIRVALLAHPMSQVRAGTAHRASTGEWESITESCLYHYTEAFRLTTPARLREIAQQLNAGVFQGDATVLQRSVLEVLPEIKADVAYFDPPYPGVMSYEKEYRVIDQMLEGTTRPTSPFTAKTGASMLDTLFERATHIPVWILSLGNEVVTIEELEGKMLRLGRRTKAIAIKYQHLPAVSTEEKKRENREFLVVGWDPEASLLREVSGRSERVGAGIVEGQADPVVPFQVDPDVLGAEAAAPLTLAGDRLEESEPSEAEEAAPDERRTVPEVKPSVDDPDAVLREPGLDGDRERRGALIGGHGATFPLSGANRQDGEAR
jgi:adenine-specific DNA-methyltransferase